MSSICGIFYRDGRAVEATEIGPMVDSMAHWKPDRITCWRQGAAALGQLALWSTPEAVTEINPYCDAASGVVVAADARLDNRAELIAQLGAAGRPAGEIGDAALIALAYLKWGDECANHLLGDFAFGLWDPRKRRLLCARDPMGVRSLHYYVDENCCYFSTELKALLTLPAVPREEDLLRLGLFVVGHYIGDNTRFRSIRVLRPAHTLTVDPGRWATRRYWSLDPTREIRFARDEDYVEAFAEVFQRAVDARLRSTGRVGCMLSGGLDATTILGVALRSGAIPRDRLTAYTWALKEGDDWRVRDERPYVEAFLRENPMDHEYLVLNSHRVFEDDPEFERFQDGPLLNLQHCAMRDTFVRAREKNIRALFLGEGGDETASYGAPDYLQALLLGGKFTRLRQEVRARAAQENAPEWQIWKSHVVRPVVRRDLLRSPFHAQRSYWEYHEMLRGQSKWPILLAPSFVRQSGLLQEYERVRPRLGWAWRSPIRCNQIDVITGQDTLAHLATSWKCGEMFGIESRFPYLDRRVVEFCVGVPPEQHRRDNWGRLLLRRCADSRIPAVIARRRDKSSTWPDVVRGIDQNAGMLTLCFERWAKIPRIASLLDLTQMQTELKKIEHLAHAPESATRPVLGIFCRAVAVGRWLENNAAK